MHIPPYDNKNKPIVDVDNNVTPLIYFNIVKLSSGETFQYSVDGYETCIVPATGTVDISVDKKNYDSIGKRVKDVWDDDPNGVYVPTGKKAELECKSKTAEIFIAGARFDDVYSPFAIMPNDLDRVQYGSDDTKTHRKIKHILGQKPPGKVGRLLLSELFTVGEGGWSGFPPHKHNTDRLPNETRHDEVYNFRFKPDHGFGLQLLQGDENRIGEAHHLVDGSTFMIDRGYHPCVVAPGYSMYYFTILAGLSQRSLVQYFHPTHAYQVETIPGIKDMIAKFK